MEQLELSYPTEGNVKWYNHIGKSSAISLKKVKPKPTIQASYFILRYSPKKNEALVPESLWKLSLKWNKLGNPNVN